MNKEKETIREGKLFIWAMLTGGCIVQAANFILNIIEYGLVNYKFTKLIFNIAAFIIFTMLSFMCAKQAKLSMIYIGK
jgi:hypothetical protein